MKNLLLKLVDWILYTSLFAASCAVGLSMATERLLVNHVTSLISPLHILIWGGVLVVYNTHFLLKKSKPELSDLYGWSQYYKFWHYLFVLFGSIAIVICLFFLSRNIIIACVVLSVLSFAYSIPMLPLVNKKRLRDYGWIKIILLVSVWTIVTAIFPILVLEKSITAYPFEILIRFVFLFSLCMAFDIRDMQTDTSDGVITVPNIIGLKNSYKLINLSIVLFIVLSIIQYCRYPSDSRLAAALLTGIAVWGAIRYAGKKASDRAYLGLVDGMMLLYAVLILILK